MRQVTADNIPIEREIWWFQQGVAVKVFLFIVIVALIPLLYSSYGLVMDTGVLPCHDAAAIEALGF